MIETQWQTRRRELTDGLKAGFPIGLGYFAVAFSLGIAARNAGITPFQGFVDSVLLHASAGEYAAITAIAALSPYWEAALVVFIANARYLLMSTALSQRLRPDTPLWHRFWVGFLISDEVFAAELLRPWPLDPWFTYGSGWLAFLMWASGTAAGIVAGNVLPVAVVSALSVALYGMFLAVIVPAGRKDRVVLGLVALSFLTSWAAGRLLPGLSMGNRTILLTLLLAGAAAVLFPVEEKLGQENG